MGLPEPVPVPPLPPIAEPDAVSARLVPVPPGCATPEPAHVVFVGTLVANDSQTGRFEVDQVRAGSLEGMSVGGLVDVRYGSEVRFLDLDGQYIVGARVDPDARVLRSTVREPAPLFGGNEIVGLDSADLQCPRLEDPVRTLTLDATSVESGVLTPLKEARTEMVRAVLEPAGVALLVLLGLVVVKHLFFALGRSLRDLGQPRPERRGRRAT